MPTKPKRPCSRPGCPRLTDGQYCDEHRLEAASFYSRYQRDPETAKRHGRAWQKIRKTQLGKQPLCEMCLGQGSVSGSLRAVRPSISIRSPARFGATAAANATGAS